MVLSSLQYADIGVVTQVLAKIHKGGGAFSFSTTQAEIEAATPDAANVRAALLLQTTPVAHPLTGSKDQHLPKNSQPIARGIRMHGVLAPEVQVGLEQIGRTIKAPNTRLVRAGIRPLVVAESGAQVMGTRQVDRRYAGRQLGWGWMIGAGESMHLVDQHVVTIGTATHTLDFSLGAGGMLSQWRTQDSGLDQQHLNMGGGVVTSMGFARGGQSGARVVHERLVGDWYPINPRQGGDLWYPGMAGDPWHTPPPVAAHALLAGGAPVIRFTKQELGGGIVQFDITTAPLDYDPDGRFWSYTNSVAPAVSAYAGAGYGKPVVVVGILMHTRWTFGYAGNKHVARCDVWYDLDRDLGAPANCEFAPQWTPCELHLRTGSNVSQECYAYDATTQTRVAVHSNGTLWPTAGNTKSLVLDAEAFSVRSPYEQVLTTAVLSSRGGLYFKSTDGSCIGQYARLWPHGRAGEVWGWYVQPWNNAAASPDRFVAAHHKLLPVSGDHHPRLVTPAPTVPAGVLGPFTVFNLTGSQATVEASMRELASYSDEQLQSPTIDPFAT